MFSQQINHHVSMLFNFLAVYINKVARFGLIARVARVGAQAMHGSVNVKVTVLIL